MSSGQKIVEEVVNEASIIGRMKSYIGLFVFIPLGVILILGGIYLMFKKNDTFVKINAIVENQSQNCFQNSNKACNTNISYVVNGVTIKTNIDLNQAKNKGDSIEIYYEQNNPTTISLTKPSLFMLGLFLTLFGLIFLGVTITNYYLTSKSKMYAAAEGIQTVEKLF